MAPAIRWVMAMVLKPHTRCVRRRRLTIQNTTIPAAPVGNASARRARVRTFPSAHAVLVFGQGENGRGWAAPYRSRRLVCREAVSQNQIYDGPRVLVRTPRLRRLHTLRHDSPLSSSVLR